MGRILSFRVTDDEAALIKARAWRMGMPVSDYLRRLALYETAHNLCDGPTTTTPAGRVTWKVGS
jgi:hypothetical protein